MSTDVTRYHATESMHVWYRMQSLYWHVRLCT